MIEDVRILGLTGRMGSGKDAVADILASSGYQRLSFATPIKEIAKAIGWDGTKYENPRCPCCGLAQGRELLQVLGSEGLRTVFGEKIVIDWLIQHIAAGGRYVVTDVRFPAEAQAIRDLGGIVWKIQRTGSRNRHVSEESVDRIVADLSIANDGSLADLEKSVTAKLRALDTSP